MRILVIGAGSVGGYFGGRLALAGNDVFFTARGNHLDALRSGGLHVESIGGDFHVKVQAAENFGRIEHLDIILVCVKHRDIRGILKEISAQTGKNTAVISLQNGVDSEMELMQEVPKENIVGGIAFIGAELSAPGKIRHSAAGKITIGEMDGSLTERVKSIKETFKSANFPCSISTNIQKDKWEKLAWNVGFNALCALTGQSAKEVVRYEPTRRLAYRLMKELVEVAKKKGINISESTIEKHIDITDKAGDIIPSMLQDVRAGKVSEVDILNGKVVREGASLDIPVPYNETAWATVSLIDRSLIK